VKGCSDYRYSPRLAAVRDIKLGGNPGSKDMYEEVKSIGGLFVLGKSERHEARRIDNQLRVEDPDDRAIQMTQFLFPRRLTHACFAGDNCEKSHGSVSACARTKRSRTASLQKSLENAQTRDRRLQL